MIRRDPNALASYALGLLALFVIFAHLGEGHLANFDDCYYAQKAKEMIRGGDWITPHYDGQVSLDNPPLFLWLIAGSFRVLGVRDYAAILPSAIAGVLAVVMLHRLALRLGLGVFGAWWAGAILLGTQYFLKYSRHAMFDVFLTLLFLLAVIAYLRGREGRPAGYALLGVCCGLGVLTKSVLGLFPLIVAVLHLAWAGRAREIVRPRFLLAPLAALLVIAPWYGYQLTVHGAQFWKEHIRWLLLERGLAAGSGAPGWTNYLGYFADLARIYWPWLPLSAAGVVMAIRRARGTPGATGDAAKLLLLWLLVVIGIMSAGREKKLWYIMSAFPALALCAALAVDAWIRSDQGRRRAVIGSGAVLALLALWLNFGPSRHAMRQPDLYQIARVASTTVPPGARIANAADRYWSIHNLFLFYSDHGLSQPMSDAGAVRAAMDQGAFALVPVRRLGEFAPPDSAEAAPYRVVVRSGDWALVAGAGRAGPAAPGATIPRTDPYR